MFRGYVAGFKTSLYSTTQDGDLVTGRRMLPLIRPRWFRVAREQRDAFEQRAVRAHVVSIIAIAVGASRAVDSPAIGLPLFLGIIALVVMPALQAWTTTGLSEITIDASELQLPSRAERDLRYARASGSGSLWAFLVLSLVLASGQAVVAFTDRAWWAWCGLVLFLGTGAYMGYLISRLRAQHGEPRAM